MPFSSTRADERVNELPHCTAHACGHVGGSFAGQHVPVLKILASIVFRLWRLVEAC